MELSSTKNTVPISVAIPAFKNEAALAHTLQQIFNCRPLPQEVLLHFDGGWEPSRDFSADAPVPVRLYCSIENIGPGGGRHRLISAASSNLVACFDDYSWPLDGNYFARAVAVMNLFPRAIILSPAVYLHEKPTHQALAEVSESVSFEGSASITRRSFYLQLPGYVPVPDAYGVEEADLSLQAHAAGFQLLTSPWLRAWHARPHADYKHGLAPWVKNEVLLAYLRYPCWMQPWGWLRAVRHIIRHSNARNAVRLLHALASSPAQCVQFAGYRRRYSAREIWSHHFSTRQRWKLASTGTGPDNLPALSMAPARPSKRALFIQYTNPAAYPPLQHSSQMLARAGWQVEFTGIEGRRDSRMEFPPHLRIRVRRMPWCAPGWRQKLHYLGFIVWVLWRALQFRPHWVYCSEPLSAMPGLLVRNLTGCRVIYHEHDSPLPSKKHSGLWARFLTSDHRYLAMHADGIVLPNQQRLAAFMETFRPGGKTFCVWNCPSLHEIPQARPPRPASQPLIVLYHGSIVPDRFPDVILEALAVCGRDISIRLIGYETPGSVGYTNHLKAQAVRLGAGDRFEYLGTLPQRSDLMRRCGECDAGLSLLRIHDGDINMRHMTGASNKPFDYLSQGLAIIVPNDPEWRHLYVDKHCAMACEPGNAEALAKLLKWMDDHRDEVRAMGAKGQQFITEHWNYETQFQPVFDLMEDRQ